MVRLVQSFQAEVRDVADQEPSVGGFESCSALDFFEEAVLPIYIEGAPFLAGFLLKLTFVLVLMLFDWSIILWDIPKMIYV